MTNARLIEALAASRAAERQRADEERALREIAARITAIRDPSDLLQHVVDEAARLLHAERVRIDLIGRGAGRVGYTFLGRRPAHRRRRRRRGRRAVPLRRVRPGDRGAADDRRRRLLHGRRPSTTSPTLDRAVADDGVRLAGHHAAPRRGRPPRRPPGRQRRGRGVRAGAGRPRGGARPPGRDRDPQLAPDRGARAIRRRRSADGRERSRSSARSRRGSRRSATRPSSSSRSTDAARRLLSAERSQLDIVDPATGLIRWTTASGEGRVRLATCPGRTEGAAAEIGINAAAIAATAVVVTGDYLPTPRIIHVRRLRRASSGGSGIKSVVADAAAVRVHAARRAQGRDDTARRLRRRGRGADGGVRRPGRRRDPERPADRRARPVEGRDLATRGRRARRPRDRREHLRAPRHRRDPPADRRRGSPAPRLDARPGSTCSTTTA